MGPSAKIITIEDSPRWSDSPDAGAAEGDAANRQNEDIGPDSAMSFKACVVDDKELTCT